MTEAERCLRAVSSADGRAKPSRTGPGGAEGGAMPMCSGYTSSLAKGAPMGEMISYDTPPGVEGCVPAMRTVGYRHNGVRRGGCPSRQLSGRSFGRPPARARHGADSRCHPEAAALAAADTVADSAMVLHAAAMHRSSRTAAVSRPPSQARSEAVTSRGRKGMARPREVLHRRKRY